MSTEPLRQYPDEDIPQKTRHEVDGDTATDTYHVPGRALPEDVSETEVEPAPEVKTSVPPARLVDVSSPEAVYASKPNIVHPPEDLQPQATHEDTTVEDLQAKELAAKNVVDEDDEEEVVEPQPATETPEVDHSPDDEDKPPSE